MEITYFDINLPVTTSYEGCGVLLMLSVVELLDDIDEIARTEVRRVLLLHL